MALRSKFNPMGGNISSLKDNYTYILASKNSYNRVIAILKNGDMNLIIGSTNVGYSSYPYYNKCVSNVLWVGSPYDIAGASNSTAYYCVIPYITKSGEVYAWRCGYVNQNTPIRELTKIDDNIDISQIYHISSDKSHFYIYTKNGLITYTFNGNPLYTKTTSNTFWSNAISGETNYGTVDGDCYLKFTSSAWEYSAYSSNNSIAPTGNMTTPKTTHRLTSNTFADMGHILITTEETIITFNSSGSFNICACPVDSVLNNEGEIGHLYIAQNNYWYFQNFDNTTTIQTHLSNGYSTATIPANYIFYLDSRSGSSQITSMLLSAPCYSLYL